MLQADFYNIVVLLLTAQVAFTLSILVVMFIILFSKGFK